MGSSVPLAAFLSFYILLIISCSVGIFFILCRRNRGRNRAVGPGSMIILVPTTTSQEQPRGLEASVIETFPKFAYSAGSGSGSDVKMTSECVVCLATYEDKEMLRLLPKCGHVFHVECVDTWLRMHATCPFCRADLLPEGQRPGNDEAPPFQVEVMVNVNGGGVGWLHL